MVAGLLDTELGRFGLEVPAISRFEKTRRSVECFNGGCWFSCQYRAVASRAMRE